MTPWMVTAVQRRLRLRVAGACVPVRAVAHTVARLALVWRNPVSQPPRISQTTAVEPESSATLSIPLVGLVYELLDAHEDTAQLATDFACDPAWSTHLSYLRQLQRVGREVLADACSERVP